MFKVEKNIFLEKIQIATNFISQKFGGINVIQGILLESNGETIKILSTNLNQYFQTVINLKTKEKFKIIISPQKIVEFLSFLDSGLIEVEITEKNILIKKEKTEACFPLIKYEEYPVFPTIPKETQAVKTKDFFKNVEKVIFSASKDESRPVLSGVFFDSDENNLFLVATDGFRLSLIKMKKEIDLTKIILSASFLSTLSKLIKTETIKIGFNNEEKIIVFKSGEDVFFSRLIEGDFPQYEKVIPQKTNTAVFVDKEQLLKAVRLISIFIRDQSNIIVFEIQKNKILLRPKNNLGEGKTEIEAKTEGEPLTVAFNFRFIIDFLRHISEDKKQVVIRFLREDTPTLFTIEDEERSLHIIMPVRIQE